MDIDYAAIEIPLSLGSLGNSPGVSGVGEGILGDTIDVPFFQEDRERARIFPEIGAMSIDRLAQGPEVFFESIFTHAFQVSLNHRGGQSVENTENSQNDAQLDEGETGSTTHQIVIRRWPFPRTKTEHRKYLRVPRPGLALPENQEKE